MSIASAQRCLACAYMPLSTGSRRGPRTTCSGSDALTECAGGRVPGGWMWGSVFAPGLDCEESSIKLAAAPAAAPRSPRASPPPAAPGSPGTRP